MVRVSNDVDVRKEEEQEEERIKIFLLIQIFHHFIFKCRCGIENKKQEPIN